jgi:hypothetical protein
VISPSPHSLAAHRCNLKGFHLVEGDGGRHAIGSTNAPGFGGRPRRAVAGTGAGDTLEGEKSHTAGAPGAAGRGVLAARAAGALSLATPANSSSSKEDEDDSEGGGPPTERCNPPPPSPQAAPQAAEAAVEEAPAAGVEVPAAGLSVEAPAGAAEAPARATAAPAGATGVPPKPSRKRKWGFSSLR